MQRRDLLKLLAVLSIGGPLVGCGSTEEGNEAQGAEDAGSVIIVGAGVAGMCAAYLLARRGVDVRILEAASTHGGRIKRSTSFVDFPIPLGAEWLHAERGTLDDIVDDDSVSVTTNLVAYDPSDLVGHFDGDLSFEAIGAFDDLKFVGSSWLDFFDAYLVPEIVDRMLFDVAVVSIRHDDEGVAVTDAGGEVYEADAAIVTVPVTTLRERVISFEPDLLPSRWEAIDAVEVWGGIKVFLEFAEPFYPAFLEFPDSATGDGQRAYYDAAYGQETDTSVLGLFAVGAQAQRYLAGDDDARRDFILAELDEIFDGAATPAYLNHLAQDWTSEPWIGQAYVADTADWRHVRELGQPAGDRLHFAGEGYTDGEDWGSVHAAAASARAAVQALLESL